MHQKNADQNEDAIYIVPSSPNSSHSFSEFQGLSPQSESDLEPLVFLEMETENNTFPSLTPLLKPSNWSDISHKYDDEPLFQPEQNQQLFPSSNLWAGSNTLTLTKPFEPPPSLLSERQDLFSPLESNQPPHSSSNSASPSSNAKYNLPSALTAEQHPSLSLLISQKISSSTSPSESAQNNQKEIIQTKQQDDGNSIEHQQSTQKRKAQENQTPPSRHKRTSHGR